MQHFLSSEFVGTYGVEAVQECFLSISVHVVEGVVFLSPDGCMHLFQIPLCNNFWGSTTPLPPLPQRGIYNGPSLN